MGDHILFCCMFYKLHILYHTTLTIQQVNGKIVKQFRGVAQLVARLLWEQDAAGSSPVTSTMQGVLIGFQFPIRTSCFFIPKQMLHLMKYFLTSAL